jgi:5S rRNA maturation endonuclease (ribonuclease M5)
MEKKGYINVDELMPQVSIEQAANFYGVPLPELKKVGNETRTACFLKCGKKGPTGDRALAIQADHPAKQFHCHNYGCGKGGNLVSLCDLMKPGTNAGGKPRGDRFKDIAKDLQAMAGGETGTPSPAPASPVALVIEKVNVLLKDSENERARGLTALDAKFLVEVADMSAKASAYFRRRPYLTTEVCKRWRMGYLPRDTGGEDKSGGTMRGKVVYAYSNEAGEVLTWFGRDPEFEEKHQTWDASGRTEKEPEKFHFVKGFHRGIEFFGLDRLRDPTRAELIQKLGLLLVEGPNDVIRLDRLGVPAVALCSNNITREQALKAATLARELSNGIVTVLLDCDPEGVNGMKQCLGYLAQLTPVRLAWTDRMFGGKFKGKQPESLTIQEWQEIARPPALASRELKQRGYRCRNARAFKEEGKGSVSDRLPSPARFEVPA